MNGVAGMRKHRLAWALTLTLGWLGFSTAAWAAETVRLPSGVVLLADLPLQPMPATDLHGTGLTSAFKGRVNDDTEFALAEVELPWHLSWVLRLFPELSMEFGEEHILAGLHKHLGLGEADFVTTTLVQRSGFPGVFMQVGRSSALSPSSGTDHRATTLRGAQQAAGYVFLIDGRLAFAACWSPSDLQALPLDVFDAMQMPYEREQGSAEAQFRVVCVGAGVLILVALGLVVACIVVIDKTLRRRKLKRVQRS
ncbi:hypothetical protein [Acidovorax sp.]|uniref:hypothetical protein n=1 Tax=Acidovorax sp. TaxID=1872122 RepID=UPI003919DCD2